MIIIQIRDLHCLLGLVSILHYNLSIAGNYKKCKKLIDPTYLWSTFSPRRIADSHRKTYMTKPQTTSICYFCNSSILRDFFMA